MRQYEVWFADLPLPAGRRPVLLLSRNSAYQHLDAVTVAEVTTHVRNIPEEVPLGRAEGLARRSVACLDNVRFVPRHRLRSRAGALSPTRVREVKIALGHALDWDELKYPAQPQ